MSEQKSTWQLAFNVGLLQLVLLAVSALVFLLNQTATATALLAGAAIGLVGSSAFALVSLTPGKGQSVRGILTRVYVGQATKYLLIVTGLIMAYSALPEIDQRMNVLALLAMLLLSQCAYLLAPYLRSSKGLH